MDTIASHLQILFGRKNWHTLWLTYTLTRNWHKIVGEKISSQSEPAYIQKDILWVHVRNSAWMQHLQTMKPQLIEKVRKFVPEVTINDIRWVMQSEESDGAEAQIDRSASHSLDPELEKAFEDISSSVENEECRAALCKLWRTFHKYQ